MYGTERLCYDFAGFSVLKMIADAVFDTLLEFQRVGGVNFLKIYEMDLTKIDSRIIFTA